MKQLRMINRGEITYKINGGYAKVVDDELQSIHVTPEQWWNKVQGIDHFELATEESIKRREETKASGFYKDIPVYVKNNTSQKGEEPSKSVDEFLKGYFT